MRRELRVRRIIGIAAAMLGLMAPAAMGATVVNGNFETGTLSGWLTDNQLTFPGQPSSWVIGSNPTVSPLSGHAMTPIQSGSFDAVSDTSGPDNSHSSTRTWRLSSASPTRFRGASGTTTTVARLHHRPPSTSPPRTTSSTAETSSAPLRRSARWPRATSWRRGSTRSPAAFHQPAARRRWTCRPSPARPSASDWLRLTIRASLSPRLTTSRSPARRCPASPRAPSRAAAASGR